MKKNSYYWISLEKLDKYQGKIRNSPLIKFTLNPRCFSFLWNSISSEENKFKNYVYHQRRETNSRETIIYLGCIILHPYIGYAFWKWLVRKSKFWIKREKETTIQQFGSHPKFWKLSCDIKIDLTFILILWILFIRPTEYFIFML